MKIKNITTVLLVAIFLASCAPSATVVPTETAIPTAPISNVSQTKNDVTLTITNVNYSEKDTLVTFLVKVPPQWGLDINAFPPQQALHNNPILSDETGKQYAPISGTYGLPQLDTETDGVKFENTVTFAPVKNKNVVLQVEIEISELPISQPVAISVSNHKVLDVWSITQGITFSSFTDVQGKVKLLSQSDSKMEFEFTFDRVTSGGLKLGCLSFYPDNQDTTNNVRECLLDENQVVSKVGMDIPKNEASPILFHVTASAAFTEPFIVSWSTTNK
jgi:hypothetical protein